MDGVDLILRQAEVAQRTIGIEAHPLKAMIAIVDEIACELDTPPLRARRRRQMVHQRAALWKECEHVAMAAQIANRLHLCQRIVITFAHADDQMRAEPLGPEYFRGGVKNVPIFVPAVRRLHAGAARAVKHLAVTGVEIRGNRVRDLNKIQSEAYRQVEEIRGVADAKATEIYAKAYNQSAEAVAFYEFTRTMQAYKSIIAENTTLVLSTDSDLFKFLKGITPKGSVVPAQRSGHTR